jgi:phage tail sheath protein FI
MSYKHGVFVSEVPTSIVPPRRVSAALPVVVGSAPVNQSDAPPVNKPVLAYTYQEAVQLLGWSDDWDSFTLCEFMDAYFGKFAMAPVVFINVLDPTTHTASITDESQTFADDEITLTNEGVLNDTVVVKSSDGMTTHTLDTDYTVAFDSDGYTVVTRVESGGIAEGAEVTVDYDHLDPSALDADDIVGGVDAGTGEKTGLELINEVFPKFRIVPGQIVCPNWSQDTTVAATMTAKAGNINSHFKAMALVDLDDTAVTKYSDAPGAKNTNNLTDELQAVCWPRVKLGDKTYWMSSQLAGLIAQTDGGHEDIPYASPSNHNFQMDSAVANGSEVWLGPGEGQYLNGNGIITALNFIGGWKCWGNRTGTYPAVTDPKDAFLPIRRMFNWIGNTLTLTFWQKVDYPVNRRLIETIVDSVNIWLNGLAARGFILGGRVEFLESENAVTDLMDGIIKFHVYVTPPSPAREIDFIMEYDPAYMSTLFG